MLQFSIPLFSIYDSTIFLMFILLKRDPLVFPSPETWSTCADFHKVSCEASMKINENKVEKDAFDVLATTC